MSTSATRISPELEEVLADARRRAAERGARETGEADLVEALRAWSPELQPDHELWVALPSAQRTRSAREPSTYRTDAPPPSASLLRTIAVASAEFEGGPIGRRELIWAVVGQRADHAFRALRVFVGPLSASELLWTVGLGAVAIGLFRFLFGLLMLSHRHLEERFLPPAIVGMLLVVSLLTLAFDAWLLAFIDRLRGRAWVTTSRRTARRFRWLRTIFLVGWVVYAVGLVSTCSNFAI